MSKKILLLLLVFVNLTLIYSADISLDKIMNDVDVNKVLSGEIITRMYLKYNSLNENTENFIQVPDTVFTKGDYSQYEMVTDEKAFIPYDLETKSLLDFYNIISSPSKLKGTKYYSRTDDEISELIIDAYPINEKNKKIEEVDHLKIESYLKGRFKQKDNRFGTLNFSSELYNEENNFVMVTTCEDAIPLISGKNEYKIFSFFIYDDVNKGFYYYSIYVMRIKSEMFLKKNPIKTLSPKIFSNRLRAATIQIASFLGLDWSDKYDPWGDSLKSK